MILKNYQEGFRLALGESDAEEAVFHLHLMIQRDPLDQQGIIASELQKYLRQWPSSTEKWKWPSLPKMEQPIDEWETSYGQHLQLFDENPCEDALLRIQYLALHLVEEGVLERAVYSESPSTSTHQHNDKNSATSATPRQQDFPVYGVFLLLGIALLFGVWFYLSQNKGKKSSSSNSQPEIRQELKSSPTETKGK